MNEPIITKQMLIDAKACPDQVNLFEKTFGDSVIVTVSRAKKVANLFQWDWAIRLLDGQGQAEYERVIAPALAECKRVIAAALAECKRVREAAWAEYRRFGATALAEAEYKRVEATARAEFERVTAPAWAECKRVEATSLATAFIDMHKRGETK